jgi:hypothetical protein
MNVNLYPYFALSYKCAAGHYDCVFGATTVTIVTDVSQTTTTKYTSLIPPLNIRSRTHTHSYQGISVSQSGDYYKLTLQNCGAGHSSCSQYDGLWTPTTFTVSTTNITQSLTPAIPVNVKQKIHQHSLPDAALGWYSKTYTYLTGLGYCPYGHSNCVGTNWSSLTWVRVGTSSPTTSLN